MPNIVKTQKVGQPTNELSLFMDRDNAIAISDNGKMFISSTAEAFLFAHMMSEAKMLPPNVSEMQAGIAIVAGLSLKLDPFQAVQNIAVVNNRPTLWGDALVALVSASGEIEDEQVQWFTGTDGKRIACRVSIKRKGRKSPYEGEFSLGMAAAGGLLNRPVWKANPTRMLYIRARAFALRNGFADLIMGVGVREEEEDASFEKAAASAEVQPVTHELKQIGERVFIKNPHLAKLAKERSLPKPPAVVDEAPVETPSDLVMPVGDEPDKQESAGKAPTADADASFALSE